MLKRKKKTFLLVLKYASTVALYVICMAFAPVLANVACFDMVQLGMNGLNGVLKGNRSVGPIVLDGAYEA